MSDTLSMVVCSGTDDRLEAAAILIGGAAAIGRPVNVLLQFWALDAFRAARIDLDHGLGRDAGEPAARIVRERGRLPWAETLRQAKELGEVRIRACSNSLDLLGVERAEMDPLVDDVCGIASFLLEAEGGQIVFV
jgi:peroxiredoxin family protein